MKQKRLISKVNHVKHTVFFDPLSETAFCTGMCSYSEYAFFARPWNEVIMNSIEVKYVSLFPLRGRCDIEKPISVAILSKMFASYSRWLKMHPVKRLHARNTKTACEYTHLQVWVWDACKLHKSFNYNSLNVRTETIRFTIIRNWRLLTKMSWYLHFFRILMN